MGHGATGKIREKINSKKQAHGGIFLVNECSFVLYGKLTAPRSSSPFWLNWVFESMPAGCIMIIFLI